MAVVDPYTQPIPDKITDKDGRPTREFRSWLVYDNRWKFDMWNRSGGGSDSIQESTQESISLLSQTVIPAKIGLLEKSISNLYQGGSNLSAASAKISGLEKALLQLHQDLILMRAECSNLRAVISNQQSIINNILQVV